MTEPKSADVVTIGSALLKSKAFDVLFRDAMALVEETTAYLDGEGRKDAKKLSGDLALSYASESMRLTTRLMSVASWALLVRCLRDGKMTEPEFKRNKGLSSKLTLRKEGKPLPEGFPENLRNIIMRSDALAQRIIRFDTMIDPSPVPAKGALSPLAVVRGNRDE
jgi:regulator of CtrA degradation